MRARGRLLHVGRRAGQGSGRQQFDITTSKELAVYSRRKQPVNRRRRRRQHATPFGVRMEQWLT